MILGDEAHLFGERKVEIEDTTVRAITSLIVDVAIRAHASPGMPAIYLLELLVQGTDILATRRHKKHKIIIAGGCAQLLCAASLLTRSLPEPILYWEILMIYIQLPKDDNAVGFLTLAKSGTSVLCLPENTYGVSSEHLTLLRRKRIPFKKLASNTVRLPQTLRPHNDKI